MVGPMEVMRHEKIWIEATKNLSELFSTCAKKKYAAVILAQNKRVVGFGYNGSPPGMDHCEDGACPRLQMNSPSGSAYDNCIAQHAEAGALLWSDISERQGGTMIVNGPPCMNCAKLIASSGISRVVCIADESYKDFPNVKRFLEEAKVQLIEIHE